MFPCNRLCIAPWRKSKSRPELVSDRSRRLLGVRSSDGYRWKAADLYFFVFIKYISKKTKFSHEKSTKLFEFTNNLSGNLIQNLRFGMGGWQGWPHLMHNNPRYANYHLCAKRYTSHSSPVQFSSPYGQLWSCMAGAAKKPRVGHPYRPRG